MARKGRPLKLAPDGEKVSLGLKVTSKIKGRLDQAAQESGRTQSQEAEFRIERSFGRQDMLGEILELAYDKPFADLLERLALAGYRAGFGSAMQQLGWEGAHDRNWLKNNTAFADMERAFKEVLDSFRPDVHEKAEILPPRPRPDRGGKK